MKTETLLLIAGGIAAGYVLMPEKVKEQVGTGAGGFGGFNLGDMLTGLNLPDTRISITEVVEKAKEVTEDLPLPEVPTGAKVGIEAALKGFDILKWLDIDRVREELEKAAKEAAAVLDPRQYIDTETTPAASKDERNFWEKLFGLEHSDKSLWQRWSEQISGWQDDVFTNAAREDSSPSYPETAPRAPTTDVAGEIWSEAGTGKRWTWAFTGKGLPMTKSYPERTQSPETLARQAENDPNLARAYKRAERLAERYGVS